jgi:hypothetical protein
MTDHCKHGDGESVSDILIGHAGSDELKNFLLTLGQFVVDARAAYHTVIFAIIRTPKRTANLLELKEAVNIYIEALVVIFTEIAATEPVNHFELIERIIHRAPGIKVSERTEGFRISLVNQRKYRLNQFAV